jgi:hypothetical protein
MKNKQKMKIADELLAYKFDVDTFFDAYELLTQDAKELELFLGLPPVYRMNWILKRIHKSNDMYVEEETSNKTRKGIDVEEEAPNKKEIRRDAEETIPNKKIKDIKK